MVTVRDNGIGMDRQWIEKYFLTIGISLYQSTEVRSERRRSRIDISFISQFGIGFLSSFLVADKIIIKTRKPRGTGLKITITNLRDYFDVRPLDEDFDPGTEVSLQLKQSKINYCRSLEYAGYLKTNIRFLNIPVRLQDQDGRLITIGKEPMSYLNDRTADIDFIAPLAFQHSEGYLLLRAKKNVDHQRLNPSIRRIVEKRFRDFIRIHFAHTNRVEGIPEADGYSQCWQQQIVNSFRKN